MLGMLKAIFRPKPLGAVKVHRGRVDLDRRFTIVADISAQGSMSRVYRALENQSRRVVCLKIQLREKNAAAMARASGHAQKPPEGEIAVKISHPRVVRTYECGQSSRGDHFLVMEFINGLSLQQVRDSRALRTAQKVELIAQVAEGLAAVHEAGYIHHDINPRNFLVDRHQHVKLIDFGLAVPNTEEFRRPGNRTGTIQYMAPELLRREPIDERIDIFAFGVVAFELLTGRLPYEASNSASLMLQRLNAEPLDPAKVKPKLSEELCEILRKLIAKRREDRWPSLASLPRTFRSIPVKRRVNEIRRKRDSAS